MSEVKLVRLKSGEELIGKCVINEDGSTHIDKPVILVPTGRICWSYAIYALH